MFNDARISAGLDKMIRGVDAPPVPLTRIHLKLSQPQPVRLHTAGYTRVALGWAAALTIFVITLPSIAPAFIQTIEARYRAALQALGGTAPPPAPHSLISQLSSTNTTTALAAAQAHVPFRITPPAGLPADVSIAKISTASTGVYTKASHQWHAGAPNVAFTYRRADGRSFVLMADRFDPQGVVPGKYMFEAMAPGSNREPVLIKHARFAWRNGDQIMTAIADEGINASEITTIETAMHGVPIALRNLHTPSTGAHSKLYISP